MHGFDLLCNSFWMPICIMVSPVPLWLTGEVIELTKYPEMKTGEMTLVT